jgi:hypothetical protein
LRLHLPAGRLARALRLRLPRANLARRLRRHVGPNRLRAAVELGLGSPRTHARRTAARDGRSADAEHGPRDRVETLAIGETVEAAVDASRDLAERVVRALVRQVVQPLLRPEQPRDAEGDIGT